MTRVQGQDGLDGRRGTRGRDDARTHAGHGDGHRSRGTGGPARRAGDAGRGGAGRPAKRSDRTGGSAPAKKTMTCGNCVFATETTGIVRTRLTCMSPAHHHEHVREGAPACSDFVPQTSDPVKALGAYPKLAAMEASGVEWRAQDAIPEGVELAAEQQEALEGDPSVAELEWQAAEARAAAAQAKADAAEARLAAARARAAAQGRHRSDQD